MSQVPQSEFELEGKAREESRVTVIEKGPTLIGREDLLDEPLMADAMNTAEQVIRNVRSGLFWPPADIGTKFDPFARIIGG